MSKKLTVLILGALCAHSVAASAGQPATMQCDPPVLLVPANPENSVTQYTVACKGASPASFAPAVTYSGELLARGTPPYAVKATYQLNTQSAHSKKLLQPPRLDQVATGQLTSSTVSAAALPAQFAAQTVWDASSGTLSVEETAGVWRVYSVDATGSMDEPGVLEAGVASTPVRDGRATSRIVLGGKVSRFAGKSADTLPVIHAELRLRDGKLETQIGETRVASQAAVQGALLRLDRQPKDMTRAWALAARAQYLGLEDEVRYAEQKVAAHHPELLEEFQLSVRRIQPYATQL